MKTITSTKLGISTCNRGNFHPAKHYSGCGTPLEDSRGASAGETFAVNSATLDWHKIQVQCQYGIVLVRVLHNSPSAFGIKHPRFEWVAVIVTGDGENAACE